MLFGFFAVNKLLHPGSLILQRFHGRLDHPVGDVRSLVFTDAVLDHLVHLHVLRNGNRGGCRPLAFTEFLRILRERYGFCVDVAPPGLNVSNDLLQENRAVLERRLRTAGRE